MNIPINPFYWFMCIVPVLLLIFLMVKLQWGALKAAPLTLLVTVTISFLIFRATPLVIFVELMRSLWNSFGIILVIFTAIMLYEVSEKANAFQTMNRLFRKAAPNELIRIFMIGVVFASFLQGVTGFGVPVLVTAPLLINMGVNPLWAVVIPLVGHSWGGTFGTLALAWEALLQQLTNNDPVFLQQTTLYATALLFFLIFASAIFIAYSYGKKQGVIKALPAILLISIVQGGGQMVLSLYNPQLATFIPSALSLILLILLSKSPLYNKKWYLKNSKVMAGKEKGMKRRKVVRPETDSEEDAVAGMSVFQSLFPYLLMTLITLSVLLITPLNEKLSLFAIGPGFKETITGFGVVNEAVDQYSPMTPFTHASIFLLLAALITYFYYRQKKFITKSFALKNIIQESFVRAFPPSIAVLSLLSISRVMAGTGQTLVLAEGISRVMGEYFVFVSPGVGMIGSLITGSNMSSNILFGDFQMLTSQLSGLNPAAIIGAQTAGGAIGMCLAPGNIVLGTMSTGILGYEGRILIKVMPFAISVGAIMGIGLAFIHFIF